MSVSVAGSAYCPPPQCVKRSSVQTRSVVIVGYVSTYGADSLENGPQLVSVSLHSASDVGVTPPGAHSSMAVQFVKLSQVDTLTLVAGSA